MPVSKQVVDGSEACVGRLAGLPSLSQLVLQNQLSALAVTPIGGVPSPRLGGNFATPDSGMMTKLTEDQKQVTDEMLMVRYQRGQRDAFATLVARYAPILFSVGYYLLSSEAQADRLAQETFLQMVREAATFNLETQFRTWIFGLFHKTAIATYTAESSADARGEMSSPTEVSLSESGPASSRSYRSQILARRVASRVASLPFPVREAFLFKQTGQMPMSDIAIAVGTDADTVRHLIRTALDKIQESVADTEEYARALR